MHHLLVVIAVIIMIMMHKFCDYYYYYYSLFLFFSPFYCVIWALNRFGSLSAWHMVMVLVKSQRSSEDLQKNGIGLLRDCPHIHKTQFNTVVFVISFRPFFAINFSVYFPCKIRLAAYTHAPNKCLVISAVLRLRPSQIFSCAKSQMLLGTQRILRIFYTLLLLNMDLRSITSWLPKLLVDYWLDQTDE